MKLFDIEGIECEQNTHEELSKRVDSFVMENDFLFGREDLPVFTSPTTIPHDCSISRDEFMKMGYSKRLKLFNENPQMYKMLIDND